MATTFREMGDDLRTIARELPDRVNKVRKLIVRTINFDLLQTTPVDTGAAVSNWQVTLDQIPSDPRPAFVPSPEGYMKRSGSTRQWIHRVDPEATRQQNISPALELANATIESATPDQVIYLTNNLPYIQALDEGHSSQAQLFVDRAILLGRDVLTRAKIVLGFGA